jgi:Zn-dependent metalloprotease
MTTKNAAKSTLVRPGACLSKALRVRASRVLLLALVNACASEDAPPPFDSSGIAAVAALEAASGSPWQVRFDDVTKRSEFAKPTNTLAPLPEERVRACAEFLAKFPDVFGASRSSELEGELQAAEEDGTRVIRFKQRVGVAVARDVDILVHLNADGSIAFVVGSAVPELAKLASIAPISEAKAIESARKAVPTSTAAPKAMLEAETGRKAGALAPKLVYVVQFDATVVFVDASNGEVIRTFDTTRSGATVNSPGAGGASRELVGLESKKDASGATVFSMKSDDSYLVMPTEPSNPVFETKDPRAWHSDKELSIDAVEAYYNAGLTLNYLRTNLSWSYYDNTKKALYVAVRAKCEEDNATANSLFSVVSLCPPSLSMTLPSGRKVKPGGAARSLDVVGHEIFHLVTNHIAKTHLWTESDDGGALSEALSDVFGKFAGAKFGVGSPATMGDGHYPIRSWIDPKSKDVRSDGAADINEQSYRPHYSSTIITQPWYLMTYGGTHKKSKYTPTQTLFVRESELLWWETVKTSISPSVTIRGFARTQMEIAKRKKLDLKAVGCAWGAVKVLSDSDLKSLWGVKCEEIFSCESLADGYYCNSQKSGAHLTKCSGGKSVEDKSCKVCTAVVGMPANNVCK